ncbi:MAG TPA: IS481 family transposase, partial [Acidobacteriota bacterium]
MPWKVKDAMDQRIEFVVRALERERDLSSLCREFGISRPTGYHWLNRYQQVKSLSGLKEQSRRPKRSPNKTIPRHEELVVQIRRDTAWGGKKIQHVLARDHRIELTVPTVNRIIKRNGLLERQDRHRPALERFERQAPNELWQMDFKGPYPIERGKCYPFSILDDHSRFLVGLFALPSIEGVQVERRLREVFEQYGVPDCMLMDHGTPWWSTTNGHGLTQLAVKLIKQGIGLRYSGIGHPQTQGKVERFHGTLGKAMAMQEPARTVAAWQKWMKRFRQQYNQVRPHEAIEMRVPADLYQPSLRHYHPHPPEWEYPPGAVVKRLSRDGIVYYRLRLVCEALAHEYVSLQQLDDRVLVTYRHMHIRELDTITGKTLPILKPAVESSGAVKER